MPAASKATAKAPVRGRKSWANQVQAVSGTHPVWLVLLSSMWMAFFGNLALWQELSLTLPLLNWRGVLLALGLGALFATATAAFISLFAWRWTLKPAILLCMLLVAVSSHFMLHYRTLIDAAMVVNALQTDPREALDFLSMPLGVTVLLLAVLPAWWVVRQPVQRLNFPSQAAVNAISVVTYVLLALGLAWGVAREVKPLLSAHPELPYMVNPLNSIWGAAQASLQPWARSGASVAPIALDVARGTSYRQQTRPPLFVLVIGDSARADHFALNGYGRATNPRLTPEDVLSWRQVSSCGTSTSSSLPCLVSHLGKDAFETRNGNHQNLLDVLQTAGLAVLWLDNQYGCKGQCDRVHHVDTSRSTVEGLCTDTGCLDEVMLLNLNDRLNKLPDEQRRNGIVVVMHAMGSHGPAYFKRTVPGFKRFVPECAHILLSECTPQEVTNAYDNTLLYTDHFLAETVQWLKRQSAHYSTSMIYVSDHGESLGEKHYYLHGTPDKVAPAAQRHVPLLAWVSPQQQQRSRFSNACVRGRLQEPVSHDHLFHSVLGLLDVQTTVYRRERDLFAACVR